jgi:hypothetical protein
MARWVSPVRANGALILANPSTGAGHDGVTQIDAIVASQASEPGTLLLLGIAALAAGRAYRRSRWLK